MSDMSNKKLKIISRGQRDKFEISVQDNVSLELLY